MTGKTKGETIDGAMDSVKSEIIDFLSVKEAHVSTKDISDAISRPWHSVQTRCLMLQIDGKLEGIRVGRINLWKIKT